MMRPSVSSRSTTPRTCTPAMTPSTGSSTAWGWTDGAASAMYFQTSARPVSISARFLVFAEFGFFGRHRERFAERPFEFPGGKVLFCFDLLPEVGRQHGM